MPTRKTIDKARADRRQGKSTSTQAGEFVREEIRHIREGKHGARSTRQAIAIGLSMARRAGVRLPPPRKGHTSEATRRQALRDARRGRHPAKRPSQKRSRATLNALRREGRSAVSGEALSRHARSVSRHKSAAERSRAAHKAARTRARNSKTTAVKTNQ